jgi:SAM-dependent methyltransferase
MVFFQAALLAGYAWAHVVNRLLPQRIAMVAHLAVMALALLFLPVGLASGAGDPPAEGQAVWLFGLLLASIGLPFFAVSANGPLLQAWFARTPHPQAADPYFLYAASNIGSFAALLAYPFLVEPALRLSEQAQVWTGGFVVLGAMIAACGLMVPPAPAQADRAPASAAPALARRLGWIALAFVPSGLLVAVTAHISTDVAAVPLLWVLPLALYLLTFVIAFRSGSTVPDWLGWPLLAAAAVLPFAAAVMPMPAVLALNLGVVFLASLICHGRVYALRPPADRLTEFYLYVSLGGVLGGAFCGLLAPLVFPTVIEYPLLIAAALFCAPAVTRDAAALRGQLPALAFAAAGGLVMQAVAVFRPDILAPGVVPLIFFAFTALLITRSRTLLAAAVAALTIAVPIFAIYKPGAIFVRSFFGVHRVVSDGAFRTLVHGTTIHGAMRLTDAAGTPLTGRPEPLTYYTFGGPMGDAIAAVRAVAGRPLDAGVVGLGAGSLACHAQPGDTWRFYEIDSAVVKLARDPALFRFLSDCMPDAPVVLGDARLTVPRGNDVYDVLVIDAFSSDAIPMHLLNVNAVRDVERRLRPDGVLVFHISNRHLDLQHILARIAAERGLAALRRSDPPPKDSQETMRTGSIAMALVRPGSPAGAALEARGYVRVEPDMTRRPWTDDYANILEAIADKWRSAP